MDKLKKYTSSFAQQTKDSAGNSREFRFEERAAYVKESLSQTGQKSVTKDENGKLTGISYDLVKDLPNIVENVEALRQGDANRAALDITVGQYVQERYGVQAGKFGTMGNFLKMIGVNSRTATIAQLANQGIMKFTTIPELNKNYEWLIGETVTEAVRAGLLRRGIFLNLVTGLETAAFDSIKVPVIKNANGFFQELREGETWQVGTMEFDEINMETKDVATAFRFTDRVIRNMRIDILQEALASANGKNLDIQLTNEAVERLINGNQPTFQDAAPVVGVQAAGSFDYDNDWLELVIGASQCGYSFDTVLGVRAMIKEAMALPEFKGFDGDTTKAEYSMDIPMPSDYRFFATGAMPAKGVAGGQLLFLDPTQAMTHYTTKPLTVERQRLVRNLTEEYVVSMTSVFVKKQADAAMILDSSVPFAANPFPAEYDMEVYERNAGGFSRGIGR